MEKLKFGYFNRIDYFTIEFKDFNRQNVDNENNKFIQLYVNKEPFMVVGNDLYHRDILKLYLEKFNLKFGTRLNVSKDLVPLERGEKYEMVGAGRVKFIDEYLVFYDDSADYIAKFPKGTDKNHLENFFFGNEIKELEGCCMTPSFFVKF